MVRVLEAHQEGKEIQCKSKTQPSFVTWGDTPDPAWDFPNFEYRVKPVEPNIVKLELWKCGLTREPYLVGSGDVSGEGGSGDHDTGDRVEYIELTPEVRAKLTDKGILKC